MRSVSTRRPRAAKNARAPRTRQSRRTNSCFSGRRGIRRSIVGDSVGTLEGDYPSVAWSPFDEAVAPSAIKRSTNCARFCIEAKSAGSIS